MRITTIEYRRLVNLGRYENEHLTATAEVAEGDDPSEAAAALRAFVLTQLGVISEQDIEDARDAQKGGDLEDLPY